MSDHMETIRKLRRRLREATAQERERCARIADEVTQGSFEWAESDLGSEAIYRTGIRAAARQIAAAIRADASTGGETRNHE